MLKKAFALTVLSAGAVGLTASSAHAEVPQTVAGSGSAPALFVINGPLGDNFCAGPFNAPGSIEVVPAGTSTACNSAGNGRPPSVDGLVGGLLGSQN